MTGFRRVVLTLLIFAAGVGAALGQTSNGAIVGTVADSSGAAVVGASISIVSIENGAVRTTITGPDGTYRLDSILPGTYNITASDAGFASTVDSGLVVPSSTVTTANLILKVGGSADKVEITADNSLLNTDNAQLSSIIGTEEIARLPISSLSAYELALTLPGVTSAEQGAFSNGVNFAVGGGRPRANNFLIEGQDNNDVGIHGQALQPENIEAQKEVIIIENNYTSEYGHGAGSVSNLIFKSGTNQFHGSVYERAENSSLDTSDHFNTRNEIPNNVYRENLPGFTIGGPIKRDKLFFFGSYQWDNYRSTAVLNTLIVPSAAGYATLESLLPNPRISTLIQAYGGLIGNPAQLAANGGVNQLDLGPDPSCTPTVTVTCPDRGIVQVGDAQRSAGYDTDSPELDLKGDYIAGPKDTLSLRLIRSSFNAPYDFFNDPGQLAGYDASQSGTALNAGIVETHIFSPTLLNEFRLSYGRVEESFGLASATLANPLYDQPTVSIDDINGYGIPTDHPQGGSHNTYQVQDSVSWTHGKHFFKVGFDISDTRVRDSIPYIYYGSIDYNSVAGGSTGLANYIDNFGGNNAEVQQNFGSPLARPQLVSQNYFAQDTWKATPNLSIDLGFRYEYNGAPFNTASTPNPGLDYSDPACFPSAGVTCNEKQRPDNDEWGPRIGIDYSPTLFGGHKSVIRAGFGTFYDVLFTNIIDNILASAPSDASPVVFSLTSASEPRGTPAWSTQFANLTKTPGPFDTSEPISDHLLLPRTFHWNLNVQQELPGAFTTQISYVGERGEHLLGTTEFNPYINDLLIGTDRLINSRGRIVVRDNSGDSNYHALWAELDRRFVHGFLFRAAYTYGRAEDDVSEIFTTNNESTYGSASYPAARKDVDTGLSSYDHRQRLVLTYIYAPPVWHTEGALKVVGNIVNRWSIAGITQFQTGIPLNVETGYDTNGDGISNDRPEVGNPKAPLQTYAWDDSWFYGVSDGGYCEGGEFWDTSDPCHYVARNSVHWIVPPIGTRPVDTVGRNNLISPGYQTWDMNLERTFKIWEKVSLDLRGEFFNIFNHGTANNTNSSIFENSTLTTGIPFTAGGYGAPTFAEPGPTVGGHRHARILIKISF